MEGEHGVVTDEQIDAAIARGRVLPTARRVVEAAYDTGADAIMLRFESGVRMEIPRKMLQGLSAATPAQLREIQIAGRGTGVYWPRLDVAHNVPGLLDGVFGTREWMREIGRLGGAKRTPAQAAAARANGAKGGRPKTETVAAGKKRKTAKKVAASARKAAGNTR
jgi:hypothetical protein